MSGKTNIKSVKKPIKDKDNKKISNSSKDKTKDKDKIKKDKTDKSKSKSKKTGKVRSDEAITKIINTIRKNQNEIEELLVLLSENNVQITVNLVEGTKSTTLKVDSKIESKKDFRLIYDFKKIVKY